MGSTPSFPRVSIPRDNISVVTGGNAGIGYETAKWLAMMVGTVIIACRSEERANQAIEQMNKEFEEEKQKKTEGVVDYDKLNVEFMPLDCNSLKSVMSFVESFKSSGRKLHKLFCNAGIGIQETLKYTDDGHEQIFQYHYNLYIPVQGHLYTHGYDDDDLDVVQASNGGFDIDYIQGNSDMQFQRIDYNHTLGIL
ncbi:WW domain-containing oxidoreductase-like [Argopecten irradians]|uniref:WW domain-containing oxidoreductase-like n=1 Tax=Argopecten irradians TaxID=31199 RepID=UPI0037245A94